MQRALTFARQRGHNGGDAPSEGGERDGKDRSRPGDPRLEPPGGEALCRRLVSFPFSGAARERAVRPRPGSLHRRGPRHPGPYCGLRRGHAPPRRDRGTCPCLFSPSSCGSSRTGSSSGSETRPPAGPMCGSWPRPTWTSTGRLPTGDSGRISSTGSTSSRSKSLRSGSGRAILSPSPSTGSLSSAAPITAVSPGSPTRPSRPS